MSTVSYSMPPLSLIIGKITYQPINTVKRLPGASVRNSAHGKGHEEGGFGIRKGGIEPQETPCSRASTPKTRV